jgi:hypothetical protein
MKKPNFVTQLVNFSKAVTEQVKAGCPAASDELQEERASICDGCELLDRESYRCNSCGCFLKFKIAWETSKCPEGKW